MTSWAFSFSIVFTQTQPKKGVQVRKIIYGRAYDTDTATEVATWDDDPMDEDLHLTETLYRKRTGEYFIYGRGGAQTVYSKLVRNVWEPGHEFIPQTYEGAMAWAEEHMPAEAYEAEFGEVDEGEQRSRLSCDLSARAMSLIRREAQRRETTISSVVEELAMTLERGE